MELMESQEIQGKVVKIHEFYQLCSSHSRGSATKAFTVGFRAIKGNLHRLIFSFDACFLRKTDFCLVLQLS